MSAALAVSYRTPELPWAGSLEDDERFRRIYRNVLILLALLILLGVLMPPAVQDRSKNEAAREQITTMILDNVKMAVAPKPEELSKPDLPKELEKNADVHPEDVKHKQKPAPEARVPEPNKAPGAVDAIRKKVAGIGLLADSKDLEELRGAPMAVQIHPVKPGPGVGSGVGVGVGAGNEAGVPVRSMITSNASGGSGGINTSGYSSNTGGGGLAGRSTTMVEGSLGGGGSNGAGRAGSAGAQATAKAGGTLQRGASGKAARSIEEIKLVFEKNKGAIYSIYNRALREDPGLQGKVVLELKIAPGGNVLECRIVSSDLKSPELEAKLLARIRQFDFGAKDVDQMNVTWPVDFLPS